MTQGDYQIKIMSRQEVDIAIFWAKAEGWNPGLYDAESFYQADKGGFLLGLLDNDPISCISAVRYGDSFGFLGFYIVKDGYRGQGYGIKIWHRALQYLEGRNIGLDGVVEQQSNYQKSGFQLAYRNIRYQGISEKFPTSTEVIDLKNIPFTTINECDLAFFPDERSSFLRSWVNQPENKVLGIMKEGR